MTMHDEQSAIWSASAGASLDLWVPGEMWLDSESSQRSVYFGSYTEHLVTILALSLHVFLNRIMNSRLIVVSLTDMRVSAVNWEWSPVLRGSLFKISSEGNCIIPLLYTVLDRIAEFGSLTILSCKYFFLIKKKEKSPLSKLLYKRNTCMIS